MTKINQEEYEILKSLDDKWKWIARDEDSKKSTFPNELWLYEYKPQRPRIHWLGKGGATKRFGYDNLFQFIKDKDSEPYSIAELIEEYENSPEYVTYISNERTRILSNDLWSKLESEEKEVNKQKLIEKWESAIEAAEFYGRGKEDRLIEYMRNFVDDLNQLDEPEVLSQEWIDEHKKRKFFDFDEYRTEVILVEDLQNLLVPKQELPVIPQFVAEWIEETKPYNSLRVAFEYIAQRKRDNHDDELAFWVEEGNSETFARAWLDGYTVEEEPLYRARLKVITDEFIASYLRTQSSDAEDRLKALEIGSKYIHEDYRHLSEFTEDELKRLNIWDSEQWEVEELEE